MSMQLYKNTCRDLDGDEDGVTDAEFLLQLDSSPNPSKKKHKQGDRNPKKVVFNKVVL